MPASRLCTARIAAGLGAPNILAASGKGSRKQRPKADPAGRPEQPLLDGVADKKDATERQCQAAKEHRKAPADQLFQTLHRAARRNWRVANGQDRRRRHAGGRRHGRCGDNSWYGRNNFSRGDSASGGVLNGFEPGGKPGDFAGLIARRMSEAVQPEEGKDAQHRAAGQEHGSQGHQEDQ